MSEKIKSGIVRAYEIIKAAGGALAALGALMLWLASQAADMRELKTAPAQISAVRGELQRLHDVDASADKRLSLLEQDIRYIKEGVQELREDARERRRR